MLCMFQLKFDGSINGKEHAHLLEQTFICMFMFKDGREVEHRFFCNNVTSWTWIILMKKVNYGEIKVKTEGRDLVKGFHVLIKFALTSIVLPRANQIELPQHNTSQISNISVYQMRNTEDFKYCISSNKHIEEFLPWAARQVTYVKTCDVGEAKEGLEKLLWRRRGERRVGEIAVT